MKKKTNPKTFLTTPQVLALNSDFFVDHNLNVAVHTIF